MEEQEEEAGRLRDRCHLPCQWHLRNISREVQLVTDTTLLPLNLLHLTEAAEKNITEAQAQFITQGFKHCGISFLSLF